MPTLQPARFEHVPAILGAHSLHEAVNPLVTAVLRLIGTFHFLPPLDITGYYSTPAPQYDTRNPAGLRVASHGRAPENLDAALRSRG